VLDQHQKVIKTDGPSRPRGKALISPDFRCRAVMQAPSILQTCGGTIRLDGSEIRRVRNR